MSTPFPNQIKPKHAAAANRCAEQFTTKPIRLFLVENQEILRMGLLRLFDQSKTIRVVGDADNGAIAVKKVEHLKPDVVMMEYRLSDGSSIDICRQIRAVSPQTRIVFLVFPQDQRVLPQVINAEASGVVLRQSSGKDLICAIETVAAGKSIFDPAITEKFLQLILAQHGGAKHDAVLPPQQYRVLALLADGKTNRQISGLLGLSERTVRNYVRILFLKLGCTRRAQAATYFIQKMPSPSSLG